MQTLKESCLIATPMLLVLVAIALNLNHLAAAQFAAAVLAVCLAIGLGAVPALAGYQFTAWIVAAVLLALLYPARFLQVGDVNLRNPVIILLVVQAVMFGMGTQMSLRDFAGVVKMPWAVLVGLFCQFTIMPLVGFGLTRVFALPDEIAAGIILIGSCSSGLASNVMVYLARGNLALSITLTATATLLAPVMTPFWMKTLAGTLVEVHFFAMMFNIIKMVIVPIGAALIHDFLKRASVRGALIANGLAALGFLWFVLLLLGVFQRYTVEPDAPSATAITVVGFLLGAVVAGVCYHHLWTALGWLDRVMPVASMFGIIYFTLVTTAAGRNDLLKVGGLLFLAAAIHNGLGYTFGYWLSRALGMNQSSARTVAMEVGLQNGGMASGLAGAMGKLATVGLASAVFSPWMNVTGSILANHWRKSASDADGEV